MNDPMNPDPFDRELDQLLGRAFAARPDGPVSTPSMLDVRHRARLRHRRRMSAMVGSVALVGVGGAAVLAKAGDDGQDRVATPGAGSDLPSTIPMPTTTGVCVPVTTIPVSPDAFATTTVTFLAGDGGVDTPLPTGTENGPLDIGFVTTTTLPPDFGCGPDPSLRWACSGPLGQDDLGRPLFSTCEWVGQTVTTFVDTTAAPCDPNGDCDLTPVETTVAVATTIPTTCPPSADCLSPTTTGLINGGTSPAIDPNATSTTVTG